MRSFAIRLHRLSLAGVVLLTLLALALQDAVAHALKLENPGGIVPIVAAGGIWLALSVDRGLLQARRAYRPLAANLMVEGGMRMAFVLILTGAGFGVTGACVGVLIGEAAAAAHARFESTRRWAAEPNASGLISSGPISSGPISSGPISSGPISSGPGSSGPSSPDAGSHRSPVSSRRHLATDVVTAFGCLAFLALLQNLDVILLGRESPRHSGEYAAISVASKAIVFGAIALGSYLLPEATIRWHKGEHALRQLATTALILAVPTFVLLVCSIAAPKLLIRIAFGPRLVGASGSFATLVAAMVFLCVTVLLTNYLLGAGRRWIVAVLGAGTAAAAVVFYQAHGEPLDTARADLLVQAVLVGVVSFGFLRVHKVARRRPGLQ